jgi:hypothetical protein
MDVTGRFWGSGCAIRDERRCKKHEDSGVHADGERGLG